uniref:BED-type domain-containing protein n=1 Tax=Fagus sylvatica TaxID=28930 RepID=A0A2N9E4H7_FAGSY
MGRPRDEIWSKVVVLDKKKGHWMCPHCEIKFFGGVERVRCHLAKIGWNGIRPCDKVPNDVQARVMQQYQDSEESRTERAMSHLAKIGRKGIRTCGGEVPNDVQARDVQQNPDSEASRRASTSRNGPPNIPITIQNTSISSNPSQDHIVPIGSNWEIPQSGMGGTLDAPWDTTSWEISGMGGTLDAQWDTTWEISGMGGTLDAPWDTTWEMSGN